MVDQEHNGKLIYLEYKNPNKIIEIKDFSLTITGIKFYFDDPMSSIPSDSKSTVKNYTLTEKEINDLISFIQDHKFFDLENSYGAPESVRSYTTSILVKMHGSGKTVTYRSNPAYPTVPEEFKKIESYILDLRK